VGGGIAFGPRPRSYRTEVPRKVRRLARQSALNARAATGAIHVLEEFAFSAPRTRQLAELLAALKLTGQHILVLTAETNPNLYLSGRNIPDVRVMRYRDAAAYDVLWADALVVEQAALGGTPGPAARAERPAAGAKAARTRKAAAAPKKATGRAAGRAKARGGATARRKPAAKSTGKAGPKPKAKRTAKKKTKKGGGDA
jgi:hypothetical protein